tara:strand:+ start:795 stop:1184 length:390 start_codon:yes stop_codon:yes gene_type:complete
MATLTPTLTLVSTDALTDSLNLTATDSLSILGQSKRFTHVCSDTKANLLLAADYTKSYVYLKNNDAAIVIHIGMDTEADDSIDNDATDLFIELAAGEFAFFPWSSTYNLHVDAASGTPTLEVMIFQAVA